MTITQLFERIKEAKSSEEIRVIGYACKPDELLKVEVRLLREGLTTRAGAVRRAGIANAGEAYDN